MKPITHSDDARPLLSNISFRSTASAALTAFAYLVAVSALFGVELVLNAVAGIIANP